MNGLREKIRNKKGFTLVEMLIVVAIIAILIAISIPMVGAALEKSRHAVDQANIRDAISLASVEYMTNMKSLNESTETTSTYTYYVNSTTHQGTLVKQGETAEADAGEAVKPQCTCSGASAAGELTVTINHKTGACTPSWTFNDDSGISKTTGGGSTP